MSERTVPRWCQALAYAAGVVSGFVAMVAGASPVRRWRPSRAWRALPGSNVPRGWRQDTGAFGSLRASLIGNSKEEVADQLGAPPAAAMGPAAAPVSSSGTALAAAGVMAGFWSANTWYYPFDPERHAAIAVLFDGNRVVRVEFIGGA